MPPAPSLPLPATQTLRKLGRDLALARRKRGISTSDMAARLFVSRDTLWRLERGDATVALGTLATAAFVLQLWLLSVATGINDPGQIVGFGHLNNGQQRAFLLTPRPPVTYAVRNDGTIEITSTGTLQEAPSLDGPYVDLGVPTVTINPATSLANRFFQSRD